jgi:hypothetical protein
VDDFMTIRKLFNNATSRTMAIRTTRTVKESNGPEMITTHDHHALFLSNATIDFSLENKVIPYAGLVAGAGQMWLVHIPAS